MKISRKEKILLFILLIVVIAVVYYMFFYTKHESEIQELNFQLEEQKNIADDIQLKLI